MIWGRVADYHITESAPFEMTVDEENIGADGYAATAHVVSAVENLPTVI